MQGKKKFKELRFSAKQEVAVCVSGTELDFSGKTCILQGSNDARL